MLIAGCGDVGLRVARRLLERGVAVSALRRQPALAEQPGLDWIGADLTRPASLQGLPAIDRVVYLPTPANRDEDAYRAVFVEGLRNLLGALDPAHLRRVVLVSSSAVYGEHHGAWVDEDTAPAPLGFNGRVLLEAERWLAGQPVTGVVLRLAGLYGPGRLDLVRRLREGRVAVPRTQTHWANRIHTEDAARAIVHLLDLPTPAPCYIGCDDTPLPLDVLYDALSLRLGLPPAIDGPAPRGIGSKRLSSARLRASGFVPCWPDAREGYRACLGS